METTMNMFGKHHSDTLLAIATLAATYAQQRKWKDAAVML